MPAIDVNKVIDHLCNIYELRLKRVRLNRVESKTAQDIVCEIDDILDKSRASENDEPNIDPVKSSPSDEEMDVDVDVKPSIESLRPRLNPTGSFINTAADAIPAIKLENEDAKVELERLIGDQIDDYLYICVYCKHRSDTGHIDEIKLHFESCPANTRNESELVRIPNLETFLSFPLFDMKKAVKLIKVKKEKLGPVKHPKKKEKKNFYICPYCQHRSPTGSMDDTFAHMKKCDRRKGDETQGPFKIIDYNTFLGFPLFKTQ